MASRGTCLPLETRPRREGHSASAHCGGHGPAPPPTLQLRSHAVPATAAPTAAPAAASACTPPAEPQAHAPPHPRA
eukprot:2081396-Prymnesium_polylepis.2